MQLACCNILSMWLKRNNELTMRTITWNDGGGVADGEVGREGEGAVSQAHPGTHAQVQCVCSAVREQGKRQARLGQPH